MLKTAFILFGMIALSSSILHSHLKNLNDQNIASELSQVKQGPAFIYFDNYEVTNLLIKGSVRSSG